MQEVLALQKKMLERLNQDTGPDDDEMGELLNTHLYKTYRWLEQQTNIDVLYVSYNDLIAEPLKETEEVNRFLGVNFNAEEMAGVIDKELYRNKSEA